MTAPPTASGSPSIAAALAPVLAAEHTVVWAYGTLGSRLPAAEQDKARTLLVAHERARDSVRDAILAAGGKPPAAKPAYELPFALTDAASARRLAAFVESRLAAVYADLVAAESSLPTRQLGVTGLTTAAVRSYQWGGTPVAFPGLPERAPATPPS